MDYIQTVKGVNDQTFTIVIAPPGSALDSELARDRLFVHSLLALIRSGRRGWRIAVSVDDRDPFYRERVTDQLAAERRAAQIAAGIRSETWQPWRD